MKLPTMSMMLALFCAIASVIPLAGQEAPEDFLPLPPGTQVITPGGDTLEVSRGGTYVLDETLVEMQNEIAAKDSLQRVARAQAGHIRALTRERGVLESRLESEKEWADHWHTRAERAIEEGQETGGGVPWSQIAVGGACLAAGVSF